MDITYSIIIPTLSGSSGINQVLNGLCRQSISKEKFEIIIVDDGSPVIEFEKLTSVIEKFKELNVRIVRSENNYGPATARNIGIDNAVGEYIFFTDDDCDLPAGWMETHMKMYKKYPQISAVCGWYTESVYSSVSSIYKLWILAQSTVFNRAILGRSHIFSEQNNRLGFVPCNTANLSVHRSVTRVARFNEVFITPGYEDLQYGESIVRAGFSVLYIPYFILHYKEMSFIKFIKMAKNRGYGLFVYNLITPYAFSTWKRMINYFNGVDLLLHVPLIDRNRFKLKILIVVWHLYASPFANFFYRINWRRKMKYKSINKAADAFIAEINK